MLLCLHVRVCMCMCVCGACVCVCARARARERASPLIHLIHVKNAHEQIPREYVQSQGFFCV
jgi:hypothetical protein